MTTATAAPMKILSTRDWAIPAHLGLVFAVEMVF